MPPDPELPVPNAVAFPECIMDVLVDQLETIEGVTNVFRRELDPTDPNGSVGLCFELWTPVEVEMGGRGFDPTLSNYVIQIEHLVKHAKREEGNLQHRTVARSIRSMLYRDQATQVRFRQLAHINADVHERLMKWSIEQRFASNKIASAFYFVSGTTVTFQTETV
jgi:hypothetical protein